MADYYAPETAACRPFIYGDKIWIWSHWSRGDRYGEGEMYDDDETASRWVLHAFDLVTGEEIGEPLTVRIPRYANPLQSLYYDQGLDSPGLPLHIGHIDWDRGLVGTDLLNRECLEPHVLCGRYSVLCLAWEGELVCVDLDTREIVWRKSERDPFAGVNNAYWPIMYAGGLLCCGRRRAVRTTQNIEHRPWSPEWGDDGPEIVPTGVVTDSQCGLIWIDPATGDDVASWQCPETGSLWQIPDVDGDLYVYSSVERASAPVEFTPLHAVDLRPGPYPPQTLGGRTLDYLALRFESPTIPTTVDVTGIRGHLVYGPNYGYWTVLEEYDSTEVRWWYNGLPPADPTPYNHLVYGGTEPFSLTLLWRALYRGSSTEPLTGGKASHSLTNGCLIQVAGEEESDPPRRDAIVLGPIERLSAINAEGDSAIDTPTDYVWRAVAFPVATEEPEETIEPQVLWTRIIARAGARWGRRASPPISVGDHVYTIVQDFRANAFPVATDYGPVRMIVLLASTGEVVADDPLANTDSGETVFRELVSDGARVICHVGDRTIAYPCKPDL